MAENGDTIDNNSSWLALVQMNVCSSAPRIHSKSSLKMLEF